MHELDPQPFETEQTGAGEEAHNYLQRLTDVAPAVGQVATTINSETNVELQRSTERKSLLTKREIEFVHLGSLGLNAGEIADKFGITQSSVENRLRKGFIRLGSSNLAQTIAIAFKEGWLPPYPSDIEPVSLDLLTAQQKMIIAMIAQGLSNVEITRKTSLSSKMIAIDLKKANQLLGAGSRPHLVRVFLENGGLDTVDPMEQLTLADQELDNVVSGLTSQESAKQSGLKKAEVLQIRRTIPIVFEAINLSHAIRQRYHQRQGIVPMRPIHDPYYVFVDKEQGKQQLRVLQYLSLGFSCQEIAPLLQDKNRRTVEDAGEVVNEVVRLLDAKTPEQAVDIGFKKGLLGSESQGFLAELQAERLGKAAKDDNEK